MLRQNLRVIDGFALELRQHTDASGFSMMFHNSPYSQRTFCEFLVVKPELKSVKTSLRKAAIQNAKGNTNHFQRVGHEFDGMVPGYKNRSIRFFFDANDFALAASMTIGQYHENA